VSVTPWDSFVAELALIARMPTAEIEAGARLVEDLGLDSVALSEVVVVLIDQHGADPDPQLLEQSWEGLTVRGVFDAFRPR
jgi:acyl carrier protein